MRHSGLLLPGISGKGKAHLMQARLRQQTPQHPPQGRDRHAVRQCAGGS
ncbi:hypothetical protein UMZ34_13860 [Halopseudomonas pachastrellae]|nr:hypothetical protein UMZ34_13860 [Halopseudomonas pachastrellae]